jgi:archaellum component FlaF (FlaF/FlaG flagellin family)
METAIAALIILAIVLFGVLTMTQVYLSSQDAILESWREMEERLGERARTDLAAVGAKTIEPGYTVTVTLRNEGSTKLADFNHWDVIVQYDREGSGNVVKWLSYVDVDPESNCNPSWFGLDQWCKDIGDVFEPKIFNPEEAMTITIGLTIQIGQPTTNTVIIATPNGISASAVFTR